MRKKTIFTFIILVIFKILLEVSYIIFVNPVFSYDGFTKEMSMIKLAESYFMAAVIFVFMISLEKHKNSPSKIIVYLLGLFLFVPITSLFWLQNQPRSFMYFILLAMIIIVGFERVLPKIKFFSLKEGKTLVVLLIIIISIIVYGILIFQGGLSRININLMEVYEVREKYTNTNNRVLGYLLPWQAHVVNMLLLALALYKKRYKMALSALFLQLLLFSMTNFKSFLFAPFVLLFFYLFEKTKLKNKLLLTISLGTTFVISISLFIYSAYNTILLASIFIRRLFFVPAYLHFVYFSFFEKIEKYKLSHSFLDFLFDNPHNVNPVKLVASNYFGKDFAPNVGFFGDAYLNFGYFGIVLFALLLAILLKVIDTVSTSVPVSLSVSILIIPSMSLINSAFFTSLLTHGILFAIFMLWLSNSLFK